MARVYLGLGSNQSPHRYVPAGLAALRQRYHFVAESPWYGSPALGFDGPDFVNLVVLIETDVPLTMLARQLKQLEREFGRPDDAVKFSSRNLDVDILLYDDLVGSFGALQLPRRDVYQFAFVLRPLLDLAPALRCPESGNALADWLPEVESQPLWLLPSSVSAVS